MDVKDNPLRQGLRASQEEAVNSFNGHTELEVSRIE